MKRLKPIRMLGELRFNPDPRYAKLAIESARNLGMPAGSLTEAMRSLETVANETNEDGVVEETNALIDLLKL